MSFKIVNHVKTCSPAMYATFLNLTRVSKRSLNDCVAACSGVMYRNFVLVFLALRSAIILFLSDDDVKEFRVSAGIRSDVK